MENIVENNEDQVKNTIIAYLNDKDAYEEIDDTLIKELLFNIKLCDKCRADIEREGHRFNLHSGRQRPLYTKNKSLDIYQDALKNVNTAMISLGLTVRERQKFKLAINDPENFDKIMSS